MHRYVGLLLVPFLIIVALSGSALAFYNELDRWLNPTLLTVPAPEPEEMASSFDPFALREKMEQLEPRARIDWLNLHLEAGQSYQLFLLPRINPETNRPFELPHSEIYINPYTDERLGGRTWGEAPFAKENIMPFLYRLHYTLALPENIVMFGVYALGIASLLWFFDSFVGFYLTFPAGRKQSNPSRMQGDASPKDFHRFLKRWKPAWLIKYSRFNYDLHRACGLWVWAMLLVIAWSGVALNLKEVYQPVMSAVFNMRELSALPQRDEPVETPKLDWRAAHQTGKQHVQKAANQYGFIVDREVSLSLDREHGVYSYQVKSNRDAGKYGATVAIMDANTGELISLTLPDTDALGDTIDRWITWLHTARVFGLPMQMLISFTGLIVVILSISGVIIWWKKRSPQSERIVPEKMIHP